MRLGRWHTQRLLRVPITPAWGTRAHGNVLSPRHAQNIVADYGIDEREICYQIIETLEIPHYPLGFLSSANRSVHCLFVES